MSKSTWAKVAGWAQFLIVTVGELVKAQGLPHSLQGWLMLSASLLTAISVHHASNTGGAN